MSQLPLKLTFILNLPPTTSTTFKMISPSPCPSPSPSPAAAPIIGYFLTHQNPSSSSSSSLSPPSSVSSSKSTVSFSPPLIAMVAVVVTAFLIVSYSRVLSRHFLRLHRRLRFSHHHLPTSSSASFSSSAPPFLDSPPSDAFNVYSPYGLDDHVIKTIPLSLFTCSSRASSAKDCAVCLVDFEDKRDYVRTLPNCSHSFHVECIDMWLRSHATCPLCRAGILAESPFTPLMASRIRPSLDDDVILNNLIILEEENYNNPSSNSNRSNVMTSEIIEEEMQLQPQSQSRRSSDFVLKRSYSFGYERGGASERMVVVEEAVTASPWRWRRGGGGGWKRMSPFGMIGKGSSASRVFSVRYNHYGNYRKSSPLMFRRRGGLTFIPQSESRFFGGGRRGKFGGSPMMMVGGSRLRCGDPEALLSRDRFNNSSR